MTQRHQFTIHVAGIGGLSHDVCDRLIEAGLDDASPVHQGDHLAIEFSREASTAGEAVLTAVRQVLAAAVGRIDRIDPPETVMEGLLEAASQAPTGPTA
jgi:hypothetical protein